MRFRKLKNFGGLSKCSTGGHEGGVDREIVSSSKQMAASKTKISLWVRPEPFHLGILPVAPHPKLAIKFLRRIIPYAQSKGQLGYPKLSYSVWKHIACHKLQLPEAIAWMYFTVYRTLHRPKSESKLQWDCHFAKRTDVQERDHLKSLTTVDTLKFVLLLYLQLFNKITLHASSVTSFSSEEWPNFKRTTEHVSRSTARRVMKILDEHYHLSFVGRSLVEILELLGEHNSLRMDSDKERMLPLEIIEAMSFIIEGTLDNMKSVLPLHDILLSPALRNKVGFCTSKKAFVYRSVVTWIRHSLCSYPYGIASCLSIGKQVPYSGDSGNVENAQVKNWSMISNANSGLKSHRYLIITRCDKQTIAKCSESLSGITARIHRCHSSFIYLLVPLKSVVITKCRDTTIVLGPVATTVMVAVCKGVQIITICRRISISNCQSSAFHLLTPTQPVLIGNCNEALTLAPFHTSYPKVEEHMTETGIGHLLNLWDSPVCLADDGNQASQINWKTLSPEDFYIFNIPIEMEGNSKKIPGVPIPRYQNAMREKQQQMDAWHHLVKNSNLSWSQREQLNKIVRARFQAWLITSGNQQELDGLFSPSGTHTQSHSSK